MKNDAFHTKRFPLVRRISIDSTRLSRQRNYIHGLIEADITNLTALLKEHKRKSHEKVSLIGYISSAITRAIHENPAVHALRRGNKLYIPKNVDLLMVVETQVENESFPVVHVIEKAQELTPFELSEKIRELKRNSLNEEKKDQWKKLRFFIHLPWFLRKMIYKSVLSSPDKIRKWIGTTSVSAVGVFGRGSGWGIGLPNQTISFTIGGISERPVLEGEEIKNHRFLNITISIDHDIVDGAPAARFTSSLRRRIEYPEIQGQT